MGQYTQAHRVHGEVITKPLTPHRPLMRIQKNHDTARGANFNPIHVLVIQGASRDQSANHPYALIRLSLSTGTFELPAYLIALTSAQLVIDFLRGRIRGGLKLYFQSLLLSGQDAARTQVRGIAVDIDLMLTILPLQRKYSITLKPTM